MAGLTGQVKRLGQGEGLLRGLLQKWAAVGAQGGWACLKVLALWSIPAAKQAVMCGDLAAQAL